MWRRSSRATAAHHVRTRAIARPDRCRRAAGALSRRAFANAAAALVLGRRGTRAGDRGGNRLTGVRRQRLGGALVRLLLDPTLRPLRDQPPTRRSRRRSAIVVVGLVVTRARRPQPPSLTGLAGGGRLRRDGARPHRSRGRHVARLGDRIERGTSLVGSACTCGPVASSGSRRTRRWRASTRRRRSRARGSALAGRARSAFPGPEAEIVARVARARPWATSSSRPRPASPSRSNDASSRWLLATIAAARSTSNVATLVA